MKWSLRENLKKIQWLRYLVKLLRKTLEPTAVYRKSDYFHPSLPTNNLESIDKEEVIVVGSFKSEKYLLKSAPKRLIENAAHFFGVWEPDIAEFIYSALNKGNKGSIMLDIGANIGATTIPQAVNYPNLNFVCIEAHPAVYERLQENISINQLRNVQIFNKAITNSQSGQHVEFYAQDVTSENFGLSSLTLNHDIENFEKITIEASSVDTLLKNIEGKVCLIKIDTQGGELAILHSATNTIIHHRPIIIFEFEEEYHSNPKQQRAEIYRFFEENGYQLFTMPSSTGIMYKVTFKGFFHGDIVAIPMLEL
jgi:FkbM family methyltransferase